MNTGYVGEIRAFCVGLGDLNLLTLEQRASLGQAFEDQGIARSEIVTVCDDLNELRSLVQALPVEETDEKRFESPPRAESAAVS